MPEQKSQTSLVGASGEHFVLYRLLRMGYLAALAPQGAPNADIICTDVAGEKTAVIQVKTRRDIGADKGWHMKSKHELLKSKKMFYCFVDYQKDEMLPPTVFIVPSNVVADALKEMHEAWFRAPGKNGKEHKATEMRRLLPNYSRTLNISGDLLKRYGIDWMEKYRENWNLLGIN
ncbi:hypothetical protein KBC54_02075 [Patescibacteria group bacterium]|nr:hypothetical protein [Patescibacteria group bacterium]